MNTQKISKIEFFYLVDLVLKGLGRGGLKSGSPQEKIIEINPSDQVLQILAGPGSGKTEMLVWRVLYELFVLGTDSNHIMVTTFTKKAATELTVRLVERSDLLLQEAHKNSIPLIDPRIHDLRVGTIHSLCDNLLSEFDAQYMQSGTMVIDEIETQVRLARTHRRILGYNGPSGPNRVLDRLLAKPRIISLFAPPWEKKATWPRSTMNRMDFLAAVLGMQTETWVPRCQPTNKPNGLDSAGSRIITDDLIKLQSRWENYLKAQNILDFTTLQKWFLDRQGKIQFGLKHVFVDEFQDTNPIQFAIHTGWLGNKTRLTTVGDDDQAMYRFRGSDIDCFKNLAPFCASNKISFRSEKLEKNWRSTHTIVSFSSQFKQTTILSSLSMPKKMTSQPPNTKDVSPRLLYGDWKDVCACVADELAAAKIGCPTNPSTETAAILMFSTSEKSTSTRKSPALVLHEELKARKLRVYNPRNKTAAEKKSPVVEILGLISYLIDPIRVAPAGRKNRKVEVWASHKTTSYRKYADVSPMPDYSSGQTSYISEYHAKYQKWFRKNGSKSRIDNITLPGDMQDLIDYVDIIRQNLKAESVKGSNIRLTIAGFVARLLTFSRYKNVGFNADLFRQALFTELLEANIAPTRLSPNSMDSPLKVTISNGKIVWPSQVWSFLNTFGSLLDNADLDDVEVDTFAEHAVSILTFHQCKGLEFDRVYVAGTGRDASPHSVLRTMLFSGQNVPFKVVGSQPTTGNSMVNNLALADREREVFVALTRAKHQLTILHDPKHTHPLMSLNPGIESLFNASAALPSAHPKNPAVMIKEYK